MLRGLRHLEKQQLERLAVSTAAVRSEQDVHEFVKQGVSKLFVRWVCAQYGRQVQPHVARVIDRREAVNRSARRPEIVDDNVAIALRLLDVHSVDVDIKLFALNCLQLRQGPTHPAMRHQGVDCLRVRLPKLAVDQDLRIYKQ